MKWSPAASVLGVTIGNTVTQLILGFDPLVWSLIQVVSLTLVLFAYLIAIEVKSDD